MNKQKVGILIEDDDLLPSYATDKSAGADLRAAISEDILLHPGKSISIPTGVYLEIPKNFEAQIRPRSGLALNNQITVLNTPGTIDADYRGEIKIILINHGTNIFIIKPKMRIAQLVLSFVYQAEFIKKEKLMLTQRGGGGFGHTGTN